MKSTNASLTQTRSFIVISTVLAMSACGGAPEPEVAAQSRPGKLMTIGDDSGGITLEYPGAISAATSVELGFEVPGKIIEFSIEEGDKVEEGSTLARLDPTDFRAARDAAQSNRTALSAAYERAKKIFEQGAGSQAEVDRTLRDIEVAKEQLKSAQKALDDTTLKAPFSGDIPRKIAENFQNVQAKEPILLLQDISSLEMDVTVPEQDFIFASPNISYAERTARARPEIVVSSIPGQRFPARFKSLSTAADPVTRTYHATFAFDNPADINILPGMTAKVILHLPAEKLAQVGMLGFMVASGAVVADEQGEAYVWRVDPDTMQVSRAQVELGPMGQSEVRVLSGLEPGERIAISGVHYLSEGMMVRPLGE